MLYHRVIDILLLISSTFEISQCRTNILANDFITVVSPRDGKVCLVLSLNQSMLLRLNMLLYRIIHLSTLRFSIAI